MPRRNINAGPRDCDIRQRQSNFAGYRRGNPPGVPLGGKVGDDKQEARRIAVQRASTSTS